MNWQEIAIEQMLIIENLTTFCEDLIYELAQYRNVEDEERRLREGRNER